MVNQMDTKSEVRTEGRSRAGRSFCIAVAALALVLPAAAPAAGQGDNTAVAINTRDGSSIFRLAFQVSRVMSDTVDQGNAAVAYSSCEACETIAVAIQVVLIFSDPEVVSPENVAVAINSECSLCVTIAEAYQFVYTTGGPVRFDAEGNRELAEIRHEVLRLLQSEGLSLEEFQSRLDALMQRLKVVVEEHLVAAGRGAEGVDGSANDAQPDATPEPDESASASPSPTASPGGENASPSPSATTSPQDGSSTESGEEQQSTPSP